MGMTELMRLDQQSPADWGAKVDYDSRKQNDTNQVFVHWTGNPVPQDVADGDVAAEQEKLRGIEKYHMKSGWNGIAYDWAIGNSGTLYRLRGDSRSGATGGDIDQDHISNNEEAEAILMIVGKGQLASDAALATLSRVCSALGYDEIYGHRESAEQGSGTITACPGTQIMDAVRQIRDGDQPTPTTPSTTTTSETGFENMRLLKNKTPMMKGNDVKAAQTLLRMWGHDIKADGVYGPKTAGAVEEFQEGVGISVDGVVGPNTRRELNGG